MSIAAELLDLLIARVRLGPRRPLALGPDSLSSQWPAIRATWLRGRGNVYRGPVGPGAWIGPEAKLVDDVAERGAEGEALAFAHLDDPDPTVAGHCLAVLERQHSELLCHLPLALLERREEIYSCLGCKAFLLSLGEWGRHLAESRARR